MSASKAGNPPFRGDQDVRQALRRTLYSATCGKLLIGTVLRSTVSAKGRRGAHALGMMTWNRYLMVAFPASRCYTSRSVAVASTASAGVRAPRRVRAQNSQSPASEECRQY